MGLRLSPIEDADVRSVAEFLHAHLNERVPAESWARAMRVPWKAAAPNHGFMLRDADGTVVGAYLAFYSERIIDGRPRRFCNLGAWCVLPEHRFHSLKLLRALLAQDGYHFTDLSPSGNVLGVNTRLGFEFLDTATAIAPNLPWPSVPGRGRVSSDPATVERTLTGTDLEIYRDHAGAAAARHAVLLRGDRYCYVVFRKDRRKDLPVFASILHVSDPGLFRELARPFARHLLLRHGAVATLAELRVVGHRPPLSRMLAAPRRKMFRGADLPAEHIDYLYSELTCVSW